MIAGGRGGKKSKLTILVPLPYLLRRPALAILALALLRGGAAAAAAGALAFRGSRVPVPVVLRVALVAATVSLAVRTLVFTVGLKQLVDVGVVIFVAFIVVVVIVIVVTTAALLLRKSVTQPRRPAGP